MSRDRHRGVRATAVAIEITGDSLHLVKWHQEQKALRSRSVRWRIDAAGLTHNRGAEEFRAALQTLAVEEHLVGAEIRVVLGGEFCVTRHVSGPRETVLARVHELESECGRFLLLGQGQKLAASQLTQQEDGSYRGLVSAFNRQALNVILNAFAASEMKVSQVNPAAVLLAGLVHNMDPENSGGLLLRLRDQRADILVIDQGSLLLDVRPARQLQAADLAGFLEERRALLERFFGWHALTSRRKLDCVYVAADAEASHVRTALLDQGLSVQAVADQLAGGNWLFSEDSSQEASTAALGALCGELPDSNSIEGPDLLSVLSGQETQSLRSRLKQTMWPLAAAALLCMMFHSLRVRELRHSAGSEPVEMVHEDLLMEIEDLEYEHEDRVLEIDYLQRVIHQSRESSLTALIASVAACLPDDGSLTTWMLNQDGTLQLQGRCTEEEYAYQFVEYVTQLPLIRRASLTGTKAGSGDRRASVEFDVMAELNLSPPTTGLADASDKTIQ
ncbi:MAG: hypothetical protein NXI04_26840 [Planctomycetaceae bacterium]|nr:hypothetical protein [Planctomycetaceae bacterium]